MEWLKFSQDADAWLGSARLVRLKARAASLCMFEQCSLGKVDVSKE